MYGLCKIELLFITVLKRSCVDYRAVWDIIRLLIRRGGGGIAFYLILQHPSHQEAIDAGWPAAIIYLQPEDI